MREPKQVVGILLIATLKYSQFLKPLVDQIDKYFLPGSEKLLFIFTDNVQQELESKSNLFFREIPSYKFPYATLYRYKIFSENKHLFSSCDYLFYMDVDMAIVNFVGDEILNKITVVHHAGFYKNNGWGSPNVSRKSTAFIEPKERKEYVAGGFNGGEAKEFLMISHILAHNIEIDEENGVMAEWQDESHLNALISKMSDRSKLRILTPTYCMVEQEHLQKLWGIYDLPKKIIALAKNHSQIRN